MNNKKQTEEKSLHKAIKMRNGKSVGAQKKKKNREKTKTTTENVVRS